MDLKLLVILSAIPDKLAEFYMLLGLTFDYHKHGQSPYHYSTQIGPTVLEIYPLAKSQEAADPTLRIGISLNDFDNCINRLEKAGANVQPPIQTEWGFMAIVIDPEGRKIALYK